MLPAMPTPPLNTADATVADVAASVDSTVNVFPVAFVIVYVVVDVVDGGEIHESAVPVDDKSFPDDPMPNFARLVVVSAYKMSPTVYVFCPVPPLAAGIAAVNVGVP